MSRRAVYAGTFDPVTSGHLDLIRRAVGLFDHITVLVAENAEKHPWFTAEERAALIAAEVADCDTVSVDRFGGLIVDYMKTHGIGFMIRGLRTVSDFEYEYQMAMTNRSLLPEADTVFMMPSLCYSYLSSRLIKAVAKNGGDIANYVPPAVARALVARAAERRGGAR